MRLSPSYALCLIYSGQWSWEMFCLRKVCSHLIFLRNIYNETHLRLLWKNPSQWSSAGNYLKCIRLKSSTFYFFFYNLLHNFVCWICVIFRSLRWVKVLTCSCCVWSSKHSVRLQIHSILFPIKTLAYFNLKYTHCSTSFEIISIFFLCFFMNVRYYCCIIYILLC